MADIQTYLDYILSKIYGKDVRQAIVDAINQCYADATAGMTPVITTEQIAGGTKFTVTVGSVSTSFDVMNGISPQVATANTAADMTDTSLIYVYVGSESGYTNGNWYYHNGSAWVSGGIYNATALVTDKTLSNEGEAADSKKVGDEITDLKSELSKTPTEELNKEFTIIENSQVTSSTGVISERLGHSRTDYTDVMDCEFVTLSGANVTVINYCFYDETKTYITGSALNLTSDIQRPSNAKYIIVTCSTGTINNFVLTLHNVPTVVSGIYDTISGIYDTIDSEIDGALSNVVEADTVFGEKFVGEKTLLQNVIGVTKFPNNLIVASECINNAYIEYQSGAVSINRTGYFCTGYIPVTAGTTYKSNIGRNWAWYNSAKTYISGQQGVGIQNGIVAPQNAEYIRFTVNKNSDGIDSPVYLYFTDTDSYDLNVTIPNLTIPDPDVTAKPWCYGKKINWIGDSIVDGADFDEQVCTALGLTKLTTDGVDGGINGSTIALDTNGGNSRHALCLRYVDMPNDADIIAVSCGTNDFEYAWCPIGTINDPDDGTSNTTFYGALKTLCKGLIDKYPQKVIFFTTPIKRGQAFESGNGGEYTADGVPTTPFSKNKYGQTLMDYADIIKEVCGYYSIPVLDMYRESLLNPHIASQQGMFDNVLTHPSVTGQKIMARRVCGWITQLGYEVE